MNDKGVCRSAPATTGLVIILRVPGESAEKFLILTYVLFCDAKDLSQRSNVFTKLRLRSM